MSNPTLFFSYLINILYKRRCVSFVIIKNMKPTTLNVWLKFSIDFLHKTKQCSSWGFYSFFLDIHSSNENQLTKTLSKNSFVTWKIIGVKSFKYTKNKSDFYNSLQETNILMKQIMGTKISLKVWIYIRLIHRVFFFHF